jgi:antitoxin (DNA-binding transcriptional repressor) of toxin-antitoxin stability system
MITATLQEAKAKLHQLVEKARSGETVVLMRGSEIVAEIRPLSSSDLEIHPTLTDRQAEKFWQEVDKDGNQSFSTPVAAVSFLKKSKK